MKHFQTSHNPIRMLLTHSKTVIHFVFRLAFLTNNCSRLNFVCY